MALETIPRWEDSDKCRREEYEVRLKKRKFLEARTRDYEAEKEHLWKKYAEDHPDPQVTPFIEKPFGLPFNEVLFFKDSVVSVGLFNGKKMVYSCSGTAVQYCNENIQQRNTIFVTTKCLAENFEKYRTRDDNLKVRVKLPDNTTICGYLGLYDDNVAIVTAFKIAHVYPVNTEFVQATADSASIYAVGRTYDGDLMGARCSPLDFSEGILSSDCAITQAGLGGPVIVLDQDRNEYFAGVMVEVPAIEAPAVEAPMIEAPASDAWAVEAPAVESPAAEVRVKFLPRKLLDEVLQLFTQSVTETTHFREYFLPEHIKRVVPAGFKSRSLKLEYLGYPLPPPLVFELNGSLVGTFEEMFGELHACEGFHCDLYEYGPEKPIWERLEKDVVKNLSQSVVSISSFNDEDGTRYSACTGLLIISQGIKFVLTSASLCRTDNVDGMLDTHMRFEVFLSKEERVSGRLVMYHQGYNIAVLDLDYSLGAAFAQDIFKVPKPSKSTEVVAIGRPTKEHEGLLMASKGNLKRRSNKDQGSEFDCKALKLSTCKIKKVGTGGPLIRLEDGSFVGMNFCDESRPTPYLPRSVIAKVLKRGFSLLPRWDGAIMLDMNGAIMLDMDTERNASKKNRWPVPKPYWYLPGNRDVLDQLVGKVPM